jgi:hypothetical protein
MDFDIKETKSYCQHCFQTLALFIQQYLTPKDVKIKQQIYITQRH